MGPIEIVASRASQTATFPPEVAERGQTDIFPGRTYPPLDHRTARVPGTRPRGQGVDKSGSQDLKRSAQETKLLIVVRERNS